MFNEYQLPVIQDIYDEEENSESIINDNKINNKINNKNNDNKIKNDQEQDEKKIDEKKNVKIIEKKEEILSNKTSNENIQSKEDKIDSNAQGKLSIFLMKYLIFTKL